MSLRQPRFERTSVSQSSQVSNFRIGTRYPTATEETQQEQNIVGMVLEPMFDDCRYTFVFITGYAYWSYVKSIKLDSAYANISHMRNF